MNKIIILTILCFNIICKISGQSFQQITTGQGYSKQSFINLKTGNEKLVSNETWDLAFTAFGLQDGGIFINESAGISMGQATTSIELYDALVSSFDAVLDIENIKGARLYNSEKSWNYGALNETRDSTSAFDYGWGKYDFSINKVIGNHIYVIKLRNGDHLKLMVESLNATTYNFKYANLDGSNVVNQSINKTTDNFGQKIIYFSFATGQVVDILPQDGFDLIYCRYTGIAQDPNGTTIQQYNVTGVLNGIGTQVAEADGVDVSTVSVDNYASKFSKRTDVIGFDWKTLVGTAWNIDQDRIYFLKTADNTLWKIRLIDFEGSSTGTAVIEKTNLGLFSSSSNVDDIKTLIYPNPVQDQLIISFDTNKNMPADLNITIFNTLGQTIYTSPINRSRNGLNVIEVSTSDWEKGNYFINLKSGSTILMSKSIAKL